MTGPFGKIVYDELLTCQDCKAEFRCRRTSKPRKGESVKFCPACRSRHTGFYSKRSFMPGHRPKKDE